MNFILIVGLVYLYLKYRDVSKELLSLDTRLDGLDLDVEKIENFLAGDNDVE